MKWEDVYPEAADQAQIDGVWRHHRPFVDKVLELADGGPLLEVGLGSGAFLVALAEAGHRVDGVDNYRAIVRQVKALLKERGLKAKVREEDGMALSAADGTYAVAYSQGVLEHFADWQIRALLWEQLRVARYAVASVPSERWVTPALVEPDRRMDEEEWMAALTGDDGGVPPLRVREIFRYWHDMMLCIVLAAEDQEWPAEDEEELDEDPLPEEWQMLAEEAYA